jgi:hypothetical protein
MLLANCGLISAQEKLLLKTYKSEWYGDSWGAQQLIEYKYDEQFRLKSDLLLIWDGFEYVNSERNIYEYKDSLLTGRIQTRWLDEVETNIKKIAFEYNDHSRQTAERGSMWDSTGWYRAWLSEYKYDSGGQRKQWLYSEWKDGKLKARTQRKYIYNDSGNLLRVDMYYKIDGEWQHKWIYEFYYDSTGVQTGYMNQTFRNDEWTPLVKGEIAYDESGRIDTETIYYYSGQWVFYEKYLHEYDEQDYEKMMIQQVASCGRWENYLRENYEYGGPQSADEFVRIPEIIVYPNPAVSRINIKLRDQQASEPQITLVGRDGRSHKIEPAMIDCSAVEIGVGLPDMPAGAYFLRINIADNIFTKKIIIGE